MESFCKIRDVYRAITEFEAQFEKRYGLGLNEGSLLCALHEVGRLSSGDIAKQLNLTQSNASKVIRAAENKGLIQRSLGEQAADVLLAHPRGRALPHATALLRYRGTCRVETAVVILTGR